MKNTIFVLTAFVMSICASAAEPIRVACIGDSITYGFGLADRAAESYPAQLQRLLNECFPGGYEVRNFGNSGRGIYLDIAIICALFGIVDTMLVGRYLGAGKGLRK